MISSSFWWSDFEFRSSYNSHQVQVKVHCFISEHKHVALFIDFYSDMVKIDMRDSNIEAITVFQRISGLSTIRSFGSITQIECTRSTGTLANYRSYLQHQFDDFKYNE